MIEPQPGPGCADACIECDQFRLVQAFQILIEYSCARDPDATVLVSRDEGEFIDVKLLDHAGAVDADAASQLFERPDHAPANEGLGLRLLLARAIVEAHGGTLVAEPTTDGLLLRCCLRVSGSDHS